LRRLSVLLALGLAGCATSALDMAPQSPDRPFIPATSASGEIVAGAPGSQPGGDTLPANPALGDLPATPGIDPNKAYTLPDLIDIAERDNPTTRMAWDAARNAALVAGIAQASFLPILTASVIGGTLGGQTNNNSQDVGLGINGSSSGVLGALALTWLLYDFGERSDLLEAAKQGSVIANIAFTAAHQQIVSGVSQAYYTYEAANARVVTAGTALSNAQAIQAAAEQRGAHGVGTVVETAQARQATAQARLALVQAQGTQRDSYLSLLAAMGISPLARVTIAPLPAKALPDNLAGSAEQTIAAALARRPDMLSAYAAEKASAARVAAAHAAFFPKFFLAAIGDAQSGGLALSAIPSIGQQPPAVNVSENHVGGSVLAGVTVPVFDGGTRAAAQAQAQADADSAGAHLAETRNQAVRQIVAADTALRTSLEANKAADALAAATQVTFDAALAAYRNGVGSITDATAAQTQLLLARNAASDARSAALSSGVSLALASGAVGHAGS
jgi:outer membrane protein